MEEVEYSRKEWDRGVCVCVGGGFTVVLKRCWNKMGGRDVSEAF